MTRTIDQFRLSLELSGRNGVSASVTLSETVGAFRRHIRTVRFTGGLANVHATDHFTHSTGELTKWQISRNGA